jgi:hypothetical protein
MTSSDVENWNILGDIVRDETTLANENEHTSVSTDKAGKPLQSASLTPKIYDQNMFGVWQWFPPEV